MRRLRKSITLTQVQLALACSVSERAVYNSECGLYEAPPETIATYLSFRTETSMQEINEKYAEFRSLVRTATRDRLPEEYFVLEGEGAPLIRLQQGLVMTESDFLNSFLINPGTYFKLKTGRLRHLPDEVIAALEECGCPDNVIEWVAERTGTYVAN